MSTKGDAFIRWTDGLIAERDGLRLRVAELEARVSALEVGLREYGGHKPTCESWWQVVPQRPCTCGLGYFLAARVEAE